MKKVLITGANGFVGKYLIKEFINNGYCIIATDISHFNNRLEGVIYEQMDITKRESVDQIFRKYAPDNLINLAAISSVGQSWNIFSKTMEINLMGTINLLESIISNSLDCKVLLIGSSEEYASKDTSLVETDILDGSNPYGCSKIAQENIAKLYHLKSGLKITCTRSFNHTGIGQSEKFVLPSFCKQIAEIDSGITDPNLLVGNLAIVRDFSDVRDIVSAYRKLLETNTEYAVVNVGSGISYSLKEILDIICSFTDKKINIIVDETRIRISDVPVIKCENVKLKTMLSESFQYQLSDTLYGMFNYFKGVIIK